MTEAEKERAAVVAWLRTKANCATAKTLQSPRDEIWQAIGSSFAESLNRAARAIERGDHLKGDAA